jgi:two-component system CheB/CheR fusion protein
LSKVEEILDPARQASATAAIPQPKSSYRVLVVDDQQDVAESIAVLVQLWGHDVRVAHDDVAAMSLAAEFNPHMMLIDIHLGGLSGHHLPSRLRKAGLVDHKLLVAMTGQGEESADRSRSYGFDEHISKPASVAVLQGLFAHGKLTRH